MKKIFLFIAVAAMSITASAMDLWTGSKHVSFGEGGGLQIAADQFAAAQPGNLLKVHFTGATDGIEFKVMNEHFDHLAGSREAAWIDGDGDFKQYLTQTAVDSLKAYGLEIIGANFTCTKVELLDESKILKEGFTVWTGFFCLLQRLCRCRLEQSNRTPYLFGGRPLGLCYQCNHQCMAGSRRRECSQPGGDDSR